MQIADECLSWPLIVNLKKRYGLLQDTLREVASWLYKERM